MARVTAAAFLVIGALTPPAGQATSETNTAMEVSQPSDRTIVVKRSFAAPRQKVFDALTKPEQVPRWFQPKQMSLVSYEADLRPGGSYRYVFHRPKGARLEMRGVYQEVDAPSRWSYTEAYDFSPLQLLVTTVLEETGGQTLFTQTILYPSNEERDSDSEGAAASSADLYGKLERYLEPAR